MRVLLINEVFGTTSTGKICAQIAEKMEQQGNEVKVAYGRWANVPDEYKRFAHYFGSDFEVKIHGLATRLFDAQGLESKHATKKMIEWAEKFNPDFLWLHNIHGYYLNYPILFDWIKSRPNMEVNWTLHDCWAFTGHCAYFSMVGCQKWKTQCYCCQQKKEYPASIWMDRAKKNFEKKKKAFLGVNNMTLITPSKWLANLTRESFLKEYPVEVKYNQVDKKIFTPTPSNFRQIYNIEEKVILLGVSNAWGEKRKGMTDFCVLASMLDKEYTIFLVGVTKEQYQYALNKYPNVRYIDTKDKKIEIYSRNVEILKKVQRKQSLAIPENIETMYECITGVKYIENTDKKQLCEIICIPRTNSSEELAAIYSAADLFINPTHEDNYPTVNLEAQLCGTKILTYDVGGCKETIEGFSS